MISAARAGIREMRAGAGIRSPISGGYFPKTNITGCWTHGSWILWVYAVRLFIRQRSVQADGGKTGACKGCCQNGGYEVAQVDLMNRETCATAVFDRIPLSMFLLAEAGDRFRYSRFRSPGLCLRGWDWIFLV